MTMGRSIWSASKLRVPIGILTVAANWDQTLLDQVQSPMTERGEADALARAAEDGRRGGRGT